MKLAMIFWLLFALFIGLYITMFAVISQYPELVLGFSWIMMPLGFGAGTFFVVAIVLTILHK